jgi:hypothetical protein
VDRVEAAARVIYDAGRQHGWSGFSKPFDELDPIAWLSFIPHLRLPTQLSMFQAIGDPPPIR